MIIPTLALSSVAIGLTLGYASILDIRERRVPFKTWYPMLGIAIPMAIVTYIILFFEGINPVFLAGIFIISALLCGFFYFASAYLHLFGGADAWALIFITACMPLYPVEPVVGYPLLAYFPLSVLINAVILNMLAPAAILGMNLKRGNRAPLRYMLVGYPVDGETIENEFGFIMEDFTENEDGSISRRYLSFGEAITRMLKGERRLYTRDFKRHPEEYRKELEIYRKAGRVWISYGVPFIVPICGGFISAVIFGDFLFIVMTALI
ncbi:peptidase A24 [Methanomicrobiaceae archaeon CYW5]|uniref:A24 family peptidase C-terminal domain-containing protein n=1 Tax=Methanovulcanius yangii TaxID=1789227 RepID=UPI0029CA7D41|nr:A24 family peptidase C-terminal domain-containing protein [Methanovulcanius yangii]MBT8507158.1 peptidase A24 [Methanovulcanius yangii]